MDKKIEKKTWTWQRIAIIGAVVIGAVLLIGAIYRDAGTSRLNVEADRLLFDTVETASFQEFIPVTGIVLPIRTVFIDAVEGGKVEEKLIEDGAIVTKGQPILRLSNPDLQLNYLNQEAQIVSQINQIRSNTLLMEQQSLSLQEQALNVEYQIDLLGKRTDRNRELYQGKAIAQVEFEETQDEYEHLQRRRKLLAATIARDSAAHGVQRRQMEQSLDLMQRNLEFAADNLDNLTVKAPINGQLSGLALELGELVNQGENIAQIDDLSNYKIRARIDEYYISRIYLEQEGSFQFAGQWYNLVIKKIYPQVTNGTFEVDLEFVGKAPEQIKRGQSVSIKLELSTEEKALMLARGGFYQTTGGNWVYVYHPDKGVAYKRDIQVGRQNPNFYEILGGLQAGDIVIVSGYENFGEKEELVLR